MTKRHEAAVTLVWKLLYLSSGLYLFIALWTPLLWFLSSSRNWDSLFRPCITFILGIYPLISLYALHKALQKRKANEKEDDFNPFGTS